MKNSLPIREKETIQLIKKYYVKEGNQRDLLFFLLCINTGLQANIILNLNIEDVDRKDYILHNDKKIPLNSEIQKLIKDITFGENKKTPLFKSALNKRIERTTVYRNFKNVCNELGLKNISLSSLRKTFGYHYYQEFKDLSFLQWLFNQSTVIETMKYIGITENLSNRFNLEFRL